MFANLQNPFKILSPEDKVNLKEIELSVKRDIRRFASNAKELFQDKRYLELKNEFKRIYEQQIRLLIYYDEPSGDPLRFAMKVREFQIELRKLKSIFDTPEGFVKSEENMNKQEKKEGK